MTCDTSQVLWFDLVRFLGADDKPAEQDLYASLTGLTQ